MGSPRVALCWMTTVALTCGAVAADQPPSTTKPARETRPGSDRPAPPSAKGPEVDLRPKFVAGRQTRYELAIVSGNAVKSDQEDLNSEQTMTQTVGLALKVKSVDDEGATVELVYERIKVGIETADFKAEFDSADKGKGTSKTSSPSKSPRPAPKSKGAKPAAADPEMGELLGQIMRPMVGTTLVMKVDKAGNITSVSGGEALAGAGLGALLGGLGGGGGLAGGGGGLVPTPTAGGSGNPMTWIINGPAQKGIVHVGESWTNTDSLGGTPVGGFTMVTRHTCKSASEGGRTANLTFSGRADRESAASTDPATGLALKEAAYNGDYVWDTGKGELKSLSSTMRTAIDGKVTGFTMALDANTKVTVRRLD